MIDEKSKDMTDDDLDEDETVVLEDKQDMIINIRSTLPLSPQAEIERYVLTGHADFPAGASTAYQKEEEKEAMFEESLTTIFRNSFSTKLFWQMKHR